MDVNCEKCNTEYSLDETLVGSSGTSVRCTNCGHVFRVVSPFSDSAGDQEWLLKQADGSTFPFGRLGILQQWIASGRVSPYDMLSRGGKKWKRLGDIAEIKPFFTAARAQAEASGKPVAAGFPRTEMSDLTDTVRAMAPSPEDLAATKKAMERIDDLKSVDWTSPSDPGSANKDKARIPVARLTTSPALEQASKAQVQPQLVESSRRRGDQTSKRFTADTRSLRTVSKGPSAQQAARSAGTAGQDQGVSADARASHGIAPVQAARPPGPSDDLQRGFEEALQTNTGELDLSQIPAYADEWEQGSGVDVKNPAWAEKGMGTAAYDVDEMSSLPPHQRRIGSWIALFAVVGLISGGFYLVRFEPALVNRALGSLFGWSGSDRYNDFYVRGRENFLLDSEPNFRQADREFQQALALNEAHAPSLAGLAELYSVRAQYLKDAELDARDDAAAAGADQSKEAEGLQRELAERIKEGKNLAEQALSSDPDSVEAHRAMADIKRLSGDLDQARIHLEKAQAGRQERDPETEYVAVMIDLESGIPASQLVPRLDALIEKAPLIRAMYRRARFLASNGQEEQARQMIAEVFKLNSGHGRAKDLIARIDAGKPITLTAGADQELGVAKTTADAGARDAGATQVAKTETADRPETLPSPAPVPKGPQGRTAAVDGSTTAPAGSGVDAMLGQASKLRRKGRADRAIPLLKKVLLQSPRNVEALSELGYCYLDTGSPGEAIASFRRALGVNPRYAPAMFGLARTSKAAGQKEQALKYYEQYLAIHPTGQRAEIAQRDIRALQGPMVLLKDDKKKDEGSLETRTDDRPDRTAVEPVDSDDRQ